MKVFSKYQHPITIPQTAKNGERRLVKIMPGRQEIDDGTWRAIKDRLSSRLESGFMRASQDTSADLDRSEYSALVTQAGEYFITELCAKASPVSSGKIDGTDDYELVH